MNKIPDLNSKAQELNDNELENVVGGFSAGDQVVFKKHTKCPGCRLTIPGVILRTCRGLDPNSEPSWIGVTVCCGAVCTCNEAQISHG